MKISPAKFVMLALLAVIIAGLEILGELLDALSQYSQGLVPSPVNTKQLLVWGLMGIALWMALTVILLAIWKMGNASFHGKQSACFIFKKKIYIWLLIITCWIPCFIAYFPGIYSYDGEPQLIQYTSGEFDNHHPIFHTLIMGKCYDLGQWLMSKGIAIDGLAFYSLLQMMVLAFALATVVNYLIRRGAGRVFVWMSMAMFCVFPATPVMAISSTKDTLFTAVFVLVIGKILEIYRANSISIKMALELALYAILCMLFRRNASYVFIIMLIIMILDYLISSVKVKKFGWNLKAGFIAVCLASIVLFSITEKSIMMATDAVQGESAEALSVPLMQMARAFKSNQEEVTAKYGEELFAYITPVGLNNYRPLISDGVKQGFNNELFGQDKMSFVSLYLRMFKDYPGSYVQAFLYMTKGDWQLTDTSHCEVYKDWWRDRTGYLITDAVPVFALDYVKKSDLWPGLRECYEAIVTDCCYRNIVLVNLIFAPATYVYAVILCGLELLIKKRKDLFYIWLIIGFYLLTIIAGPCVLVRYIFPLMMLLPVLASMVWDDVSSWKDVEK